MTFKQIAPGFSVSGQLTPADVRDAAARAFKSIICNRPDGEEAGQLPAELVAKQAEALGLKFAHIPLATGAITADDGARMRVALDVLPSPVLAYCRSGARSSKIWELAQAASDNPPAPKDDDVVIVGATSAGIATAASLLERKASPSIVIVDPTEVHDYQPGWAMVGAGVVSSEFSRRTEKSIMPRGAQWIKKAASGLAPDDSPLMLDNGSSVVYRVLVACPGIKLDWDAIPGLSETLGQNGVTSNYRYDLAPYHPAAGLLTRDAQGPGMDGRAASDRRVR